MINAYLDYGIHGGNSWLQDVKLAGLWETMFTHKPFFLDVNHNEQNIAIIYYNHSIQHNTIFPNTQMSEIKWCLDNNIKVFLDDSWEFGDETLSQLTTQYEKFFLDNDIKILTNTITDNPIFVDINSFFFSMRHQHDEWNHRTRQNTYYPRLHDKEYLYNLFIGYITKDKASILYSTVAHNDLIDENSIVTKINKSDLNKLNWLKDCDLNIKDSDYLPFINYAKNNQQQILKHDPWELQFGYSYFDSKNPLNIIDERRIPQEMLNCYFSVVNETIAANGFYTEKTFKHIIAKLPFIIFGGSKDNQIFASKHGFELYDELFDYSFEEKQITADDGRYSIYKRAQHIADNVKRIKKEPISIFSQPSLTEKIEYNYYLYMKNSRTSKYKEHLYNVFTLA